MKKSNVFVKPNGQSLTRMGYAMARKGRMKSNFFQLVIVAFLCLMPNVMFAQNLTVEGTVVDEIGEPLIGVTVIVQGHGVTIPSRATPN